MRGFHVYRDIWKPLENEELECFFERHNLFGMIATKTCRLESGKIVGHLPREISRPTKFLLDRGGKVTGTHYRRSYLLQEGPEIPFPYQVTLTIPGSIKVHMLIQRYQQMVQELYCAPKEKVIMGRFLEQIVLTEDEPRPKKK